MIPIKSLDQLKGEGWDEDQLEQQQWALDFDVDVSGLDHEAWDAEQIYQLIWALDEYEVNFAGISPDLDWGGHAPRMADGRPTVGLDPAKWDDEQMEQQRKALGAGVDLSDLNAVKWAAYQMAEQRLALEVGVDISYLDPAANGWEDMEVHRNVLLRGDALDMPSNEAKSPGR